MNTIARALLFISFTFCLAAGASARTFEVFINIDTNDILPGDGVCADVAGECTLRAAITEANAFPGDDTITLPAGAYTQTIAASDNTNAGGDWDIGSNITINGAGAATTFLQANAAPASANNERVLEVLPGGNLTLTNATVRYGNVFATGLVKGGGILNSGTLSLNGVVVRENQAVSAQGSSIGGGIYNVGAALTLIDSAVSANTVTGRAPGAGFGGGIGSTTSNTAVIVITNSSISGNALQSVGAPASGGGLYLDGVYDLTAADSHFDDNTSTSVEGTEGGGARLLTNTNPSVFNITNCTFNNNTGSSTGAAAVGGGLHIYAGATGATLTGTLDRVAIDGNKTQGAADSRGGGLYVNPVLAPVNLNITNSSITNNINSGDRGGGVELSDRFSATSGSSTVNFTNTTVSGNSVTGNNGTSGSGGGVHIEVTSGPMAVNFNFVTIANNSASGNSGSGGGIAHVAGGSTVNLKNSIVADNSATGAAQDIAGTLASQDFNHIENLTGGAFTPAPHDTGGFDPQLGPLQNNGGPTLTQLLAPISSLVNRIANGSNGCGTDITADQRGFVRPSMGKCDVGAAELAPFSGGPFSISGTVMAGGGVPVRNIVVVLSEGGLSKPRYTVTGSLGNYQFTNVPAGGYTVSISSKRYFFAEDGQFVNVPFDRTGINFYGSFAQEVSTGNASDRLTSAASIFFFCACQMSTIRFAQSRSLAFPVLTPVSTLSLTTLMTDDFKNMRGPLVVIDFREFSWRVDT